MATNYDDWGAVNAFLEAAQEAEHDNREHVREVNLFLYKRDGQWDPDILSTVRSSGRPAYTFDKCNPIVDSISSKIEQADFIIKVAPAGGGASKEVAETYDGIIRNIQNISNADDIYNSATRDMVSSGLGGFRVVQEEVDSDSFDQDLLIKPISNYVDRVWFDPSAELPDQSDADYVFVLQSLSVEKYDVLFPDGSGQSVGQDMTSEAYTFKGENVVVGEIFYKKPTTITLILMSNDAIYSVDDEFETIVDELAAMNPPITEVKRRVRESFTVYQRLFDGSDWLNEEEETAFKLLPVVPMFGNFKIIENKTVYWGAIDKTLDSQRVYNYARSRQIEEGALSPREKFFMTEDQMEGNEDTLATLNTNTDPVQRYTHVEGQPPPFKVGGYNVNPGLEVTAQAASADINAITGQFGANMADNPRFQSGEAIDLQQKAGNANNIKYLRAREVAQTLTCKILIGAIPKVYDQQRQIRLLGEDNSEEIVTVNQAVFDDELGENVILTDLSQGTYDVTCKSGTSFSNRQDETVKAITEIAAVDPSIIQKNGDILYGNMTHPGMKIIGERERLRILLEGGIPQDQQTEEEQQMLQQLQQQQQEQGGENDVIDQANLMIAQAEQTKAEVEQQKVLILQQKAEIEIQEKQLKLNLDEGRLELERDKLDAQIANNQQKNDLEAQKLAMADMKQEVDELKIIAETFKVWREGQGVETIVGPHAVEATINTAAMATEAQAEIDPSLPGGDIAGT